MKLLRSTPDADPRFALIRFADGLVIRAADCPLGIMARPHWRLSSVRCLPGRPNAVCACTDEAS